MKKLVILSLSLFLTVLTTATLSKPSTTQTPQIEIKTYKQTTSKPRRKISYQYSLLTPETPAAKQLNTLVKNLLKTKTQNFINKTPLPTTEFTSALKITDSVLFYKPKKLISILYEEFTFVAGAAHPSTTHFVINYDLETKKALALQDILSNPKKGLDFIADYSMKKLKTKMLGKVNFIKTGAAATFDNYQNWNFTDHGLLITFEATQVAPYFAGAQKVLIPYKLLKDTIKPQYYKLLL